MSSEPFLRSGRFLLPLRLSLPVHPLHLLPDQAWGLLSSMRVLGWSYLLPNSAQWRLLCARSANSVCRRVFGLSRKRLFSRAVHFRLHRSIEQCTGEPAVGSLGRYMAQIFSPGHQFPDHNPQAGATRIFVDLSASNGFFELGERSSYWGGHPVFGDDSA